MKFKEFFQEAMATELPQARYAALLARRRQGLPFASPEDRDFFQKHAQMNLNAANGLKAQKPAYQPMQTPEERANAEFETLQTKNRMGQPMSPEERVRLMMYYKKKQQYDQKFDKQQGWGESTILVDGK